LRREQSAKNHIDEAHTESKVDFAEAWGLSLDAAGRREQEFPDSGQAMSPSTLEQGLSFENAFETPVHMDGIDAERHDIFSFWAPDVEGGMKTDAAVKRGNEKGKFFSSIDSYDGWDAQSDFGPPKEAERIERTGLPFNHESSAQFQFPMQWGEPMLPHRPARMSNEYKSRDGRDNVPYFARYPVDEEYPVDEGSAGTFACPFYKRDPEMFGHGKWKYCAHASWKGYHGVRFVHLMFFARSRAENLH
jgi:hypothetical protein